MRRLGSIFFLMTFLFNLGGYNIVFWGLQLKSDEELVNLLDSESYSVSDQVIITLPLTLPYPIYQEGFNRVNGQFEFEGEYYKLVKQKIENDMLVMVCVKDQKKKNLTLVMTDFAKVANNLPGTTQRTLNLLAKFFKDYQSADEPLITVGNGWSRDISSVNFIIPSSHAETTINIPPPRLS